MDEVRGRQLKSLVKLVLLMLLLWAAGWMIHRALRRGAQPGLATGSALGRFEQIRFGDGSVDLAFDTATGQLCRTAVWSAAQMAKPALAPYQSVPLCSVLAGAEVSKAR